MLKALVVVGGVALLSVPSSAADATLLREFMRVTGVGELSLRTRDAVVDQMRATYPDAPDSFWSKQTSKIRVKELDGRIETVYAKHFSDAELKKIVLFYSSPEGRKLAQAMPSLAQESLTIAQTWGQSQADKILDALREGGYAE